MVVLPINLGHVPLVIGSRWNALRHTLIDLSYHQLHNNGISKGRCGQGGEATRDYYRFHVQHRACCTKRSGHRATMVMSDELLLGYADAC
jgi:hypothetical protein